MKLSVAQLRNIIKEEVSRMLREGPEEEPKSKGLSTEDKKKIDAAIESIIQQGIPASRIGRELEKLAGKRAGHEEGSGKPGSKLRKAGKAAGADIEGDE